VDKFTRSGIPHRLWGALRWTAGRPPQATWLNFVGWPERELRKRVGSFTIKSSSLTTLLLSEFRNTCPQTVHMRSFSLNSFSANQSRMINKNHTRTPDQACIRSHIAVLQRAAHDLCGNVAWHEQRWRSFTTSKWTYTTIHRSTNWKNLPHFHWSFGPELAPAVSSTSIIRMTYGSIEMNTLRNRLWYSMRVQALLDGSNGSRNNKPIVVDHISPGTIKGIS